ncbi:hypothetical protein WA538_002307, partial [Blastocystis sp. DL]
MRKKGRSVCLQCFLCVLGVIVILLAAYEFSVISMLDVNAEVLNKSSLRDPMVPSVRKSTHSVTLVVASDLSQIEKLNFAVVAWMDEISVAVSILPKELEFYEDVLRDLHFPSRVHVSTLKTKGYWFPINELRNIAIEASTTTHIFVSDADILPSSNLRETFLSLPNFMLRDTNHALIVPLIEAPFRSILCSHWYECLSETETYTRLSKRDITWCLRFGGCKNLGNKGFNKYSDLWWENLPIRNQSTPLFCWDNIYQEPLLIVAKTSQLPKFNPSFVDYGYNRVEWVSHLRLSGYRFSVLSHAWAFHLTHDPSFYALRSKEKSDPTRGKRGGVDTAKMYEKALKKYESETTGRNQIPLCSSLVNIVTNSENPGVRRRKRITRNR